MRTIFPWARGRFRMGRLQLFACAADRIHMAQKSFIEILGDRIREDVRTELLEQLGLTEARPADPPASESRGLALDAWLLERLSASPVTSKPYARSGAYAAKPAPAQAPRSQDKTQGNSQSRAPSETASEIRLMLDDANCTVAREAFRRCGAALPDACSERELKGAFRKLALRLHPDRAAFNGEAQGKDAGARFSGLVEAYETLLDRFAAAREAQP